MADNIGAEMLRRQITWPFYTAYKKFCHYDLQLPTSPSRVMRLVDIENLELKEFLDRKKRPSYAILSHTWGEGEVSFQDFSTLAAKSMPGYTKINFTCDQAKMDGLRYVWIDTCCIDKTSSAELSEAINSMYQWYEDATVCYVYLSDVRLKEQTSLPKDNQVQDVVVGGSILFPQSRWFTRGWTLQELLAPQDVVFYDRDWNEMGTKNTLHKVISETTQISIDALLGTRALKNFSISERMSWAAMRKTTRVEDIAYCLLGIFDVNMPTLYGEGEKAFTRLQYEIMRSSDDHTLFAWGGPNAAARYMFVKSDRFFADEDMDYDNGPVFAPSPESFEYGMHVQKSHQRPAESNYLSPYSITNKGLQIKLPLLELEKDDETFYLALLDCERRDGSARLGIFLEKQSGVYRRVYSNRLGVLASAHQSHPSLKNALDLFISLDFQIPARLLRTREHEPEILDFQFKMEGCRVLDFSPNLQSRTFEKSSHALGFVARKPDDVDIVNYRVKYGLLVELVDSPAVKAVVSFTAIRNPPDRPIRLSCNVILPPKPISHIQRQEWIEFLKDVKQETRHPIDRITSVLSDGRQISIVVKCSAFAEQQPGQRGNSKQRPVQAYRILITSELLSGLGYIILGSNNKQKTSLQSWNSKFGGEDTGDPPGKERLSGHTTQGNFEDGHDAPDDSDGKSDGAEYDVSEAVSTDE